jgi:hypothetical protein
VRINRGIAPLRAVALLDYNRMTYLQRRNSVNDNLRTTDPTIWKSIVHRLIDLAQLVVIDTRGASEPVKHETFMMLDPRRARKAIFIKDCDGRCPALEVHGIDPRDHALPTVTDEELIPELRERLESARSQGLGAAPCTEPLLREGWESLPSVVVVVAVDSFDSEDLVHLARTTDKQLLGLWCPETHVKTEEANWAFDLSWEFAHNPKVALLVFEKSIQVLIRASFLRAVAAQVERCTARGHRGPLSWEQLNQPDPIGAAVHQFVRQLMAIAEQHGFTFRVVKH